MDCQNAYPKIKIDPKICIKTSKCNLDGQSVNWQYYMAIHGNCTENSDNTWKFKQMKIYEQKILVDQWVGRKWFKVYFHPSYHYFSLCNQFRQWMGG